MYEQSFKPRNEIFSLSDAKCTMNSFKERKTSKQKEVICYLSFEMILG
jgi:hypothetical protein